MFTLLRHLLLLMFALSGAYGHTVPTLVLETEFTADRSVSVSVNVDPRLFLSDKPTTLPPVPASWYLEQSTEARSKTDLQAAQYLAKALILSVGESIMNASWKFTAIDSATSTPLAAQSAEVHLLAQWKGKLPATAGDFKVALDKACTVSLIVLNGTEGVKDRRPQVIFPGETSRGYVVPPQTK